ncbi:MAG: glycoside hydrolase family 28 protein [Phycisphaerae bacterium]
MTRGALPAQLKTNPGASGHNNILHFGVMPNSNADATARIQAAIDSTAGSGGGTVFFPAGTYRVGTLWMRSHITLYLDAGATLLGIPELTKYPLWTSRWEGSAAVPSFAGLISGEDLENIAITGRGKIDGSGAFWWDLNIRKQLDHFPSRLIRLVNCRNVLIENIEINNSGAWAVVPVACDNVTLARLSIINPPDSPNTDGIDIDSCSNVHISECHIDVGDDCIALKAGKEDDLRATPRPCENVTITNCTMHRGHSAVAFGSETSGGVRNVVISNCIFSGTDRGVRFKTRRGRGGVIEDVFASNIVMDCVRCPIVANLFYGCGAWDEPRVLDRSQWPVNSATPQVRRLHFTNISAKGAKSAAIFFLGLPEMPIADIFFKDISISLDPHNTTAEPPAMAPHLEEYCRAGVLIQHAASVRLRDVEVRDQLGPAYRITDATDVRIATFDESAVTFPASHVIRHRAADLAPFADAQGPVIGVASDIVETLVRKAGTA